jgi:hypothetical protein
MKKLWMMLIASTIFASCVVTEPGDLKPTPEQCEEKFPECITIVEGSKVKEHCYSNYFNCNGLKGKPLICTKKF